MKNNLQNKNDELKHIINKISTIILMITVLVYSIFSIQSTSIYLQIRQKKRLKQLRFKHFFIFSQLPKQKSVPTPAVQAL